MIITFPMLTSQNISGNVLPGICKMLEKYVIVYQMDRILKNARKVADMERVGSSLRLLEKSDKTIAPKIGPINIPLGGGKTDKPDVAGPPKIDQALALEPTWVKVELKDGFGVLGVKIVPYLVESKEDIIKLMLQDMNMGFWKKSVSKWQRAAVRRLWTVIRGVGKQVGYKGGALTGDPRKDVLFAKTEHRHNIFTLVNMVDLQDSESFLKNTGGIRKLYSLGWRSFIIADDVNRQAHFCLQQFRGMCSMIPYSFIYSSLGVGHHKVYEDLEDVRKTGSAIFRMKGNVRKIFGESECVDLRDAEELQEIEMLTENFQNMANRMKASFNSMFAGLNVAERSKDSKKFLKVLSRVPSVDLTKTFSIAQKISPPDFKQNFEMAKRVFANSLKAPKNLTDSVACIIAFGSSRAEDPKKANVQGIKQFVQYARLSASVNFDTGDWSIPGAPDPDVAAGKGEIWLFQIGKWIAAAVKFSAGLFTAVGNLKINDKETIGEVIQKAWVWCKKHDILAGVIFVALAFIILAYLCRNQ